MSKIGFWVVLVIILLVRIITSTPSISDGTTIKITGKVSSEPVQYSSSQRIVLEGFRFYLPAFPEVSYGDYLQVQGKVEGRELKNVVLINHEKSTNILYLIRSKLIKFYHQALPQPYSSLVAGVTLGSKAQIPEDFWDALKSTGTLHVVVASGMNVTLVAKFLLGITILFFARRRAIYLALFGIWLYALLAGFDAPIIRAAIMGSLAFVAEALGRLKTAWRLLFLSASLMLIINPDWIYDFGFILSFVATASLIAFELRVRGLLHFVPKIFREGLSTSLSAQVGVAPILLLSFGQLSIFSPFINALVLWTIPPITVIGMISGMVSLVFTPLATLILYIQFPLSYYFVWVVDLFAKL